MQTYDLTTITVTKQGQTEALIFSSAYLFVHTEVLSRSWFVDMNQLQNERLLQNLMSSSDIRIIMKATTHEGKVIVGEGFMHPNLKGNNATIRGTGELIGFSELQSQTEE